MNAKPMLLEPLYIITVRVPEEYMGDVMGDVSARRGRIQGMELKNKLQHINALIPLAEIFGYATTLRSLTQGRGNYNMEPSHYEEVPKNISDKILERRA